MRFDPYKGSKSRLRSRNVAADSASQNSQFLGIQPLANGTDSIRAKVSRGGSSTCAETSTSRLRHVVKFASVEVGTTYSLVAIFDISAIKHRQKRPHAFCSCPKFQMALKNAKKSRANQNRSSGPEDNLIRRTLANQTARQSPQEPHWLPFNYLQFFLNYWVI